MPRFMRVVRYVFLFILVVTSTVAMTLYLYLQGSLPALEGNHIVPGLRGKVEIERDQQGIPTLSALNRDDIAYGTGFLHAQERFFQMDLQRRQPAGELSALLGRATLPEDRRLRPHQFRELAGQVMADATESQRRIFDAYARGVNQGLAQLREPSFEYLLMGADPEPWTPQDSVLVLISMFLQLQDSDGHRDQALDTMRQALPDDWYAFMTHADGEWEAPLQLPEQAAAPIALPETPLSSLIQDDVAASPVPEASPRGSNQWAVSGALTEHGHGLLANDMHLPQSLPNLWYRANWRLPEHTRVVSGATLPGTPAMVVGSNEHIAWGFTNSYGRYANLIRLETRDDRYLTPEGWEPFADVTEIIDVRGGASHRMRVRHTRWGPVIRQDAQGRPLVLQWAAHDPQSVNLDLMAMETMSVLEEALDLALAGVPTQNLMVADRDGRIGWTIMGALPQRADSRPQRLLDGAEAPLDGIDYLGVDARPRITDRERLWNANNRVVDLPGTTGDGEFYLGARAQQIRDGLQARDQFTGQDMLAIQLDDRGRFLDRWRDHLLTTLLQHPDREALVDVIGRLEAERPLHAYPDSVAYALVRHYRQAMLDRTLGPVFDHLERTSAGFRAGRVTRTIEYPLWAMVTAEADHLLNPAFNDWETLRQQAADVAITGMGDREQPQTWGDVNYVQIKHPLSDRLPLVSRIVDMPAVGMAGDMDMPRVQTPGFGASQRLVVAPGREDEGLFHMPGSQSGHPISPYYRQGHSDWVDGRASPLLPGEPRYQMTLIPQR